MDRAARMVVALADKLDGNAYATRSAAAGDGDACPLAATQMRCATIEKRRDGAKSKRYHYAARHFAHHRPRDRE